jgi:chromodomain-helicase-DNA-binding protein 7
MFSLLNSLPKMRIADILRKPASDIGEVQDFSIGKMPRGGRGGGDNLSGNSMSLSQTSPTSGKGKLNDMLSKLMKKNNVPMDEPQGPLSKEKKRRKLDEIVLGLSAAKQPEQKSIFGDPGLTMSSSKKPQITPSVSVTPATNIPSSSQSHMNQNQKPFTITVTSVPGKGKFIIQPTRNINQA